MRWWIFLGLLGLVLILRLQTFFVNFYNGDEANYAAHAMLFLKGGVPYVDFVEKKPPLIYVFYALVFKGLGVNMKAVHAVTALWIWATALVTYATARLFLIPKRAGFVALLAVVAAHLMPETEIYATNCEILMNLPLSLAAFFFLSAVVKKKSSLLFWSGFFAAVATLFKHQAGIFLVVVPVYFLIVWVRHNFQNTLSFVLKKIIFFCGFAVPILIVIALYARAGHLQELYEWNVLYNVIYLNANPPLIGTLRHGLLNSFGFIAMYGFFFLVIVQGVRHAFKNQACSPNQEMSWRRLTLFLTIWFVLTILPVSLGGRFYGHYYIQFLTPLVLASGMLFWYLRDQGVKIWREKYLMIGTGLLVLLFQVLSLRGMATQAYEGARQMHPEIGRLIAQNTGPDDRIFVWGNYAYAYYESQRLPATRFVTCEYLVPYWNNRFGAPMDSWEHILKTYDKQWGELFQDLAKNPPQVIVDTSSSDLFKDWHRFALPTVPVLGAWVQEKYRSVGTVEGVTLYQLKPIDRI